MFELIRYVVFAEHPASWFTRPLDDKSSNKSFTLPIAHRRNIARIALAPRGNLLLSIDEDGHAILSHLPRRLALHHFSFRGSITALAFSSSGRHFAVGQGRFIEVWNTPSTPESSDDGHLEFAPFVRHRVYAGHSDTIQYINWSSDSRFFLSAAKDLTARIWSLDSEDNFTPTTLAGHREAVIGAWFSGDQESVLVLKNIPPNLNTEELIDIHSQPRRSLVSLAVFVETWSRSRAGGGRRKRKVSAMENYTATFLLAE